MGKSRAEWLAKAAEHERKGHTKRAAKAREKAKYADVAPAARTAEDEARVAEAEARGPRTGTVGAETSGRGTGGWLERALGGGRGRLDEGPPQFDLLDKLISLRDRYAAASTGAGGYSAFFTGAGHGPRGPISGPAPKPDIPSPQPGDPMAGNPNSPYAASRRKGTKGLAGSSRRRRGGKPTPLGIPPQGVL